MMIKQAMQIAVGHHQAGRLHDAGQLYERILAQQPAHADAMYHLGLIAAQRGRFDIAASLIHGAIVIRPHNAEWHSNLGNALTQQGKLDEAIHSYRQAVNINPSYAEAHSNLGNALREKGQLDESIAACRRAVTLRPNLAEAHSNLALALMGEGQLDDAAAACRDAIALRPTYPEDHCLLGAILSSKGQLDEAIAAFRQAVALKPNFAEAHSNLVYALYFHSGYDAKAIAREHRVWNHQHAEPLHKFIQAHPNDRDPNRRLRIGYVSPDFRNHVVGRNLLPLFQNHDHQQFEITCYAHVPFPDDITRQLQKHADRWRSIVGLSDEEVAQQIRDDRIDVLVDLTLHMAKNRLLVFARKPAPVQVTFAGYPGSTGLSTIDYRLSDSYLDPPGINESTYSEQTIRLPASFWCYDPLEDRDIPVNPLPALKTGIVTFGCLNNFSKVNEFVIASWAQVLRQVDSSRLLLLAHEGNHRQRTLDRLRENGISQNRIEFVPLQSHRKYLELYHRVDLGLDTFPYNGHTTSLDSFWMGVPVVTLVGERAVSRAGWCQLANLGLRELAAHTPEQFIQIAVDLARDVPRLKELRLTLRQRMEQSPLMDAAAFTREIETVYRHMWHTWYKTGQATS